MEKNKEDNVESQGPAWYGPFRQGQTLKHWERLARKAVQEVRETRIKHQQNLVLLTYQ